MFLLFCVHSLRGKRWVHEALYVLCFNSLDLIMCCGLVNGKFGYFRSLVNAGFFSCFCEISGTNRNFYLFIISR